MKSIIRNLRNQLKTFSKIRLLFLVLCIAIFFSCFIYTISYHVDAYNNEQEMEQLSCVGCNATYEQVSTLRNISESISEKGVPEKQNVLPQYQDLYKKNSDFFGWVKIDGTNINYPVMFTPCDPQYYLHRNFQKRFENRGLPFLDGKTDIKKSSNYIVYGHSMKDGTEFADLLHYQSKRYFQEHSVIHFNTVYQTGEFKIIGVLLTKVFNQNEHVFKYYQFSYPATDTQYEDYVNNVKRLSIYDTGVTAKPGEQLLTLSTCSYHTQDGRLAVVAKRIN